MGAEDVRRQALKVFHMKMLGATVRSFSLNSKLELYLHPFTLKVARQAGIPVLIGSIGLGLQMRGESGTVQGAGISKRQRQTIYQRESTCGMSHQDSPKHRYHAGRFCG